jgi:hypothetical protein
MCQSGATVVCSVDNESEWSNCCSTLDTLSWLQTTVAPLRHIILTTNNTTVAPLWHIILTTNNSSSTLTHYLDYKQQLLHSDTLSWLQTTVTPLWHIILTTNNTTVAPLWHIILTTNNSCSTRTHYLDYKQQLLHSDTLSWLQTTVAPLWHIILTTNNSCSTLTHYLHYKQLFVVKIMCQSGATVVCSQDNVSEWSNCCL